MFFDPLYMMVMLLGAGLSMGAQLWVKKMVGKWQKVPIGRGLTGKDIAQLILDTKGISNVRIETVQGVLSDHYDPRGKVLRLSPAIYGGDTVAAAGIAAHEVGHAIQDREGYAPMRMRQLMVPVANIGTRLGMVLIFGGMMLRMAGLAKIGVLVFAGFVAFTIVTLPVEIDASMRAKRALNSAGVLSGREGDGVNQVLTAAAATYVAAAMTAIMQLLYFAWRSGLLRRR